MKPVLHGFCCDPGRVRAHATASEQSGRRRRRPTERAKTQQQDPQQQQLDERTVKQASLTTDRDRHKAREQFLQRTTKLGLMPASELEGRPLQRVSEPLPWTLSPPQPGNGTPTPSGRSSSADSSAVDALSDSTLSSSSTPISVYAGSNSDSSSTGRPDSRASTSSSQLHVSSSSGSEHRINLQLSDEDQAVMTAISRISRFLDFRERCASEVVTKLTEVGYDKQFAYKVLERLQEMVSQASS